MNESHLSVTVIESQWQADYHSGSGFGNAFSKICDPIPHQITKQLTVLKVTQIDTPLGPMIAMADNESLYLLEFVTRKGLEREVERLRKRGFAFISGNASPLASIKTELNAYFEGKLTLFKTPYRVFGSSFQQQVWKSLCQVPYGETRSYAQQASSLEKPNAYRAVANANGANQFAIIVPCHRIIASNGTLGGYGGGLAIKKGLLDHERQYRGYLS